MKLRLGTRGSALALTQSEGIAHQLRELHPGLEVELQIIKTSGDLNQRDPLSSLGGKGVFVKEIEAALLAGQIDFAVHSLKDMPSQLPAGLTLSGAPRRADARDALVGGAPLAHVPSGSRVGTGSLRRQVQLRALRPDLEYADLRGNVPTRVERWRHGDYNGGVVLACAGLQRLGEASGAQPGEIHPLSLEECVPSPCQGILGLQLRTDDRATAELLAGLADPEAVYMARAERAFLAALGGDCNLPAGGHAVLTGTDGLHFQGLLWRDGLRRYECEGPREQAEQLGRRVAEQLLSA